ncbi:metaxin-1 [Tetranychus urticae]|uniref:GST C-terminal domain-containing protein n=1 Tax=Tetranychus urticae TaxID=32264 RepID=T1KAH6_TETUR|nr:metaxin-1 [Tetranychus urticae]
MELVVWPGDHGLPSLDLTSIQLLAYCKFSGAPVKVNQINRSWNVIYRVPSFSHGFNVRLNTFNDVTAYLQRQNYNCDLKLNSKALFDVQAYMSIISQKLEPALSYIYWANDGNYSSFIRPWYAKRIPFPASLILPDRYQSSQLDKLTILIGDKEGWTEKEKSMIEEAEKCLKLLSQKLGEQKYFFGDTPTIFDAYVFGYLALCTIPFPSYNPLKSTINNLPNLPTYLSRIKRSYFPDVQETTEEKPNETENEFPNRWLDITLSSLFAASVMFTYAYLHLRHFTRR